MNFNNKELEKLTKEQLIELILDIEEYKEEHECFNEDIVNRMIEESLYNEAYMESHGRVDYGWGVGVYGAY